MENEKYKKEDETQNNKKNDIVDTMVVRLILILLIIGFIFGLYVTLTTQDERGIEAIFRTIGGMSSIAFCGIGLFIFLFIKVMK